MPAYLVNGVEAEVIVFAANEEMARRIGACRLGEGDEIDVVRSPEYDEYEALGYVPPVLLLQQGWSFSCVECDNIVTEENEQENPDLDSEEDYIYPDPAFKKDEVFCCQECLYSYEARREERRSLRESSTALILEKFPDAEELSFSVYEGVAEINFRLPGLKSALYWGSDDPETVKIGPSDRDEFLMYKVRRDLMTEYQVQLNTAQCAAIALEVYRKYQQGTRFMALPFDQWLQGIIDREAEKGSPALLLIPEQEIPFFLASETAAE